MLRFNAASAGNRTVTGIPDWLKTDHLLLVSDVNGIENGKVMGTESVRVRAGQERSRHDVGEYVRGQSHTNGIESFWALLKLGYYGTYHKMSPRHVARYIREFEGRHNIRSLDTIEQMGVVARRLEGRRLRY